MAKIEESYYDDNEKITPKVNEKPMVEYSNKNEPDEEVIIDETKAMYHKMERMARMHYATKMSNRIPEKEFHKIKMAVLNEAEAVVAHTLGPFGTYNLIQPRGGWNTTAFKSKDGFQAINNMTYAYDDPIPHAILFIINDIANHMNFYVGDGTTTGIPIAKSLYENFYNKFIKESSEYRISPSGIISIIDALEKHLKEKCVGVNKEDKTITCNDKYVARLYTDSDEEKKVTMDILKRVSTVSANNDEKIGNTISSLFDTKLKSAYPFVNLRFSDGTEDRIEKESGFEFNHGFTDDWFANQPGGLAAMFENPKFALFNGPLLAKDIDNLQHLVSCVNFAEFDKTLTPTGTEPAPLIIMAEKFGPEVLKWSQSAVRGDIYIKYDPKTGKHVSRKAQIMFLAIDIQNPAGYEKFEDFAVAVGANPFDSLNGPMTSQKMYDKDLFKIVYEDELGSAEKIVATKIDCKIMGANGDKERVARQIETIEHQIKRHQLNTGIKPDENLLRKWRTRVDMLKADMSTIYVGGPSVREQESRMSVYDDCVRAVKSSVLEGGVSLGGNLAIPHYIKYNEFKIVEALIDDIQSGTKNIVLGSDIDKIKKVISEILRTVAECFGTSYKRTLWNVLQDDEKVDSIYSECLNEREKCKTFNLVKNRFESLDDMNNCDLLVPANTDKELMIALFAFLRQMIGSQQMLAPYSISINWEDHVKYFVATGQGIVE